MKIIDVKVIKRKRETIKKRKHPLNTAASTTINLSRKDRPVASLDRNLRRDLVRNNSVIRGRSGQ